MAGGSANSYSLRLWGKTARRLGAPKFRGGNQPTLRLAVESNQLIVGARAVPQRCERGFAKDLAVSDAETPVTSGAETPVTSASACRKARRASRMRRSRR